ncbi:MAG: hypothetical protein JST19_17860 [Bacteroidetes bacterium]|nr:hypothetical protein [Bacteroidota bacterium]
MPDFISIDLDPSDDDFHKVIDTAREAKDVFDLLEAKKRHQDIWKDGYALFIPSSGFDYAQARAIAEHLCGITSEQVPDISTTEVTITNRGNKLFVDPSQNDYADTLASVY